MNLQHFLYALLNILNEMSPYILLGFLIAGLLHVFVRPEVMSRHLAGKGWKPVFKAAMFGIPLPLCSCGVLPTAVALRRQGASNGAATSFLIATPQTGVDSIAATYALLGLPFAILRPIAALTGAFAGGMAVDRVEGDKKATDTPQTPVNSNPKIHVPLLKKLSEAVRYGLVDMVGSVGKWLVIGLIIAAIITITVPDTLFLSISEYPLIAMLLMVAVAVPMYICATGSIPIALSLMLKGLSPGVAFVLLMAGPAANFASVMVLRKTLGNRATAIYVASVIVTAIAFGLVIDTLLPASWFTPIGSISSEANCHLHLGWFDTTCSLILTALLLYAFLRNRRASHKFHECCAGDASSHSECLISTTNENKMKTMFYQVKGMSCNHCKASVEKTLATIEGIESVIVDLSTGQVAITGNAKPETIAQAVTNAGFEFAGPVDTANKAKES